MFRISSMMRLHTGNTYTVPLPFFIPLMMAEATCCGDAVKGPGNGSPAVILLRINPGFTVITCIPWLNPAFRNPSK